MAGKLYYDLLNDLEKNPNPEIALVRVEQYYPLPAEQLQQTAATYPNAEFVWVQDEPENQGAWPFMAIETSKIDFPELHVVSRPASASPAAGSAKRHALEQSDLISRALSL
jgi:multifunctional 2-oxoglutarate metabolism enzyme